MFPHVPQDPRWRNFSRMRRRVSSGKRSRGRFFRGTERLFFIKRHAISSWKYIQSIAKVSYKEILREKFHEILFFDLFFFFSESVEYDWIWFWRIGYFFRRIYFLRRISHLNWLLTISMRSEKKKKKNDEVWGKDGIYDTKNESWEINTYSKFEYRKYCSNIVTYALEYNLFYFQLYYSMDQTARRFSSS